LLATATIFKRDGIEFEPYDEDEIVYLLSEIQEERGTLNREIMDKIILYISRSIK